MFESFDAQGILLSDLGSLYEPGNRAARLCFALLGLVVGFLGWANQTSISN